MLIREEIALLCEGLIYRDAANLCAKAKARLTNGPLFIGSGSWTRTNDLLINAQKMPTATSTAPVTTVNEFVGVVAPGANSNSSP